MTTDLDRLLELAEKAKDWIGKSTWSNTLRDSRIGAALAEACDPDTVLALIERVKEAERTRDWHEAVRAETYAKLRAAQAVVGAAWVYLREDYPNGTSHPADLSADILHDALLRYDEAQKARSTPGGTG